MREDEILFGNMDDGYIKTREIRFLDKSFIKGFKRPNPLFRRNCIKDVEYRLPYGKTFLTLYVIFGLLSLLGKYLFKIDTFSVVLSTLSILGLSYNIISYIYLRLKYNVIIGRIGITGLFVLFFIPIIILYI